MYAAWLLQKLRSTHSTSCEKHPLSLDAALFIEILQTKTSPLPVKKMYLKKKTLFTYDPVDKKEIFAAFAKAYAQRVVCVVEKPFSLGEGVVSPARQRNGGFRLTL